MNAHTFARRVTARLRAVTPGPRWMLAPVLCALTALPATAASSGQSLTDLSLEQLLELPVQLVYGASKYEQKVTQAPASVSIVTGDEIQRFGYRTLADVMRSMRGVYVSNDRNYNYFGTRGFLRPGDFNSRVLMLIDGHRVNDNLYAGAIVGREGTLDVSNIERVEFVRGPSSSIYGNSAFFGILNIVTKRAEQAQGLEISGDAATFDSHEGRVSYGNRFENKTGLVLTGSYYTSGGADRLYYSELDQRISSDPRAANNGIAQGLDEEEAFNLFGTLESGGFMLSTFFSSRAKQVPTASYGTLFNDPGEETFDSHGYVDLKYEHRFNSDFSLLGRAYYDRYDYTGNYPFNYAQDGEPLLRDFWRDEALGEWAGTQWQLTGRLLDRHAIVAGVEYQENLRQKQLGYDDLEPRVNQVYSDAHSSEVGVFAQDEVALSKRVLLNAGVRYDYYFDGFGGTLNPRVALIFNPRETSSVKALYGQAFRAPTAYERYYYLGERTTPELDPENIHTYELAYEQTLNPRHRLMVSVYHYNIRDLISQAVDEDGQPYYANLSRVRAKGVELEAEGLYENGVQARLSYTMQRTEDTDTGLELTSSPQSLVKFNLLAPVLGEKFSIGSELQYQGTMLTRARARTKDFWIGNLTTLSRWPSQGLEIAAGIYNVLDERYSDVAAEEHLQAALPQDGRTYRVKLTKRFGAR